MQLVDGARQLRQDPRVGEAREVGARAFAGDEVESNGERARLETARRALHVEEGEARGVPQLVAEARVARDAVDVQVDVAALARVGEEPEAERIGAALRDTGGVLL